MSVPTAHLLASPAFATHSFIFSSCLWACLFWLTNFLLPFSSTSSSASFYIHQSSFYSLLSLKLTFIFQHLDFLAPISAPFHTYIQAWSDQHHSRAVSPTSYPPMHYTSSNSDIICPPFHLTNYHITTIRVFCNFFISWICLHLFPHHCFPWVCAVCLSVLCGVCGRGSDAHSWFISSSISTVIGQVLPMWKYFGFDLFSQVPPTHFFKQLLLSLFV